MNRQVALLVLIITNLITVESYPQASSRMANENYMQTKLMDNFSSSTVNKNLWLVVSKLKKDNLYIFADCPTTISQNNSNLELSMHRHPGYSVQGWTPEGDTILTANFITAEVVSVEDFSYGIFECSATFAHRKGSFPAFWLFGDTVCFEAERPEIDIVELKVNRRNPTLDNNIWYYPPGCLPQTSHEFTKHKFSWGGAHVFKGIWTPEKIEFLVDDILLKEVFNTGQNWYPQLKQQVILSQQIVRYGRLCPDSAKIITPQTSLFHWVRVREFFLAPEITCPENISTTVTATMDVDKAATEITWELTPEILFSGITSGKGLKATITPKTNLHRGGKITYRFKMPSGETFSAKKEFILNGL